MLETLIGRNRTYERPDLVQPDNIREATVQIAADFGRARLPWMKRLEEYRGLLSVLSKKGTLSERQTTRLSDLDQRINNTFGEGSVTVISRWNRAVDPSSIEDPSSLFASSGK